MYGEEQVTYLGRIEVDVRSDNKEYDEEYCLQNDIETHWNSYG
jgi:hypothetical protein